LTDILHRWLVPYTEEIFGDYHCGFRKGQSATDNLFMLWCIPEKFYELNVGLHFISIDFKQAYDSINRTYLYESLREFGIPKKLVMLQDSDGKVKIQGQLTEVFGIERDLGHGDSLSTTRFSMLLEKVIGNIETNPYGTRMRQYIAYAGDVLILGRSVRAIEEVVIRITEAAVSSGLVINKYKTMYVTINRNTTNLEQDLIVDRQVFVGVQNFRYLGTVINSENLISDGIKSRCAAGIRCFYSRRQIFSSRAMSEAVKIKMYKMMVKPVYRSETLAVSEMDR